MMKMKSVYCCVAVVLLLLVACVPMRVVPKWSPDVYNGFKVIQGVQKKDAIGRTDPVQREIDLKECGVIKFFNGTLDFNVFYPGMTSKDVDERRLGIYACMEKRGYDFYDPVNCTNNGKDLGICN
ncbi:hypothetical protein [Lampropedia cohaerens]|uniref:hypothetical protein n=1 Tax=Lampropedia cohaerens TaxID=1610491 RepID=UPI0018D22B25|nr:hypothetical protein [Lampropedia cohaerens]